MTPATQKFTLPPEQAMMFAIEDSPVPMMGAFDGVIAWQDAQPRVQEALRNGGGVSWVDYGACLFCSHDMGDRAGAAAHVRQSLKPNGTWMIVEPMAGDRVEQNMTPHRSYILSRVHAGLRAHVACAGGGAALGAQAGEAKLREVITVGRFGTVRRATEAPFNMVLEACY
jgi:hypothetical protein